MNLSNSHISSDFRDSHEKSYMSEAAVQEYMGLLVAKHSILGEHYVARQLAWAESQLRGVQ